jgi:hypothetical protein
MDNQLDKLKEFVMAIFNGVKENPNTDNGVITIGFLTSDGVNYLSAISVLTIKPVTRFTISLNTLRHWYNIHYGENEKDTAKIYRLPMMIFGRS